MQILVNEKNEITDFVKTGIISGSININDEIIPTDFENKFKPGYYLYQNQEITVNANYTDQTASISNTPTQQQAINANLMLQVATLTAKIAKLEGSASNG